MERRKPAGRVAGSGGVGKERPYTIGCVEGASGIAIERSAARGHVTGSSGIGKERQIAIGRISISAGVCNQRLKPVGHVTASSGVAIERLAARGHVILSIGVVKKSQIDINQGSSWSNFTAFPSTSSHIPIGIEMVTPDGIAKEMLTTLDETLEANPKAWIVVYTLDLK